MAAPVFQAAGTFQAGGAVQLTLAWPVGHQADDIGILVISSGATITALTTASGFVQMPDSPQTTTGLEGAVFWCRATSGSMASVVTGTGNNNITAGIVTFRGCTTTGDPWDVTSGSVKAATSTVTSVPGDTTTVPECVILYVAARGSDFSFGQYASEADATLTGVAEQAEFGTTTGNGGGVGVWTGTKATAGAYGPLTATLANTSIEAYFSIALKPPSAAATGTVAVTQAAQTSSAAALETFTATSAQTQAAQTSTAFGSIANPVSGTVAQTQANQTSTASGLETFTGTSANVQADQTSTASGSVGAAPITGTVAVIQADQTSTAFGLSVQNLTGTVAVTQADQSSTATAVETFTGTLAETQDDQTSTATATFGFTGTVSIVQDNQTSTASGISAVAITGTVAVTQQDQFSTATANGGTVTFWVPYPVGYVFNPVAYVSNPAGFVRVGPDSIPPAW